MNILALETTGKYGSAAVISDNGITSSYSENEMNHLKDIISISDAAIKAAGIGKKDLTHVAASIGPGSFTGIRIGVTTARTLGQTLGIPCIAVSSLEGLMARAIGPAIDLGCEYILACINARRHQTYAGVWKISGEREEDAGCKANFTSVTSIEPYFEEKQYIIDELLEEIAENCGKIYVIGDGIDAYCDIFTEKLQENAYFFAKEEERYQSAEYIAEIAQKKAENGEIITYNELIPNYMRLSEAEQRLQEGRLSEKIK